MRSEAFFQSLTPIFFPTTFFKFWRLRDSDGWCGGTMRGVDGISTQVCSCAWWRSVHGKSWADLRWGRRRLFFQGPGLRRNSGRLRQTQTDSAGFWYQIRSCTTCKGVAVGNRVSGGLEEERERERQHITLTCTRRLELCTADEVVHSFVTFSLSLSTSPLSPPPLAICHCGGGR